MSLTNNKIKSTTIYGALNVVDMANGSVLSNAYISRNLQVDGTINNVPNSKFAYLTNVTSDIQTQINSITGGASNGSFSNLNVANDMSLHRCKLIKATTCTALKGIVQPRLTTPLPSRINLQPSSQVPTCELGCKLVLDGFEPWRLDLQPRSQVHQGTHLCAYL